MCIAGDNLGVRYLFLICSFPRLAFVYYPGLELACCIGHCLASLLMICVLAPTKKEGCNIMAVLNSTNYSVNIQVASDAYGGCLRRADRQAIELVRVH